MYLFCFFLWIRDVTRTRCSMNLTGKMRSTFSNIWCTTNNILTTSMLARGVKKTYVTSYPAYSLWFEHFMTGIDRRMDGEVLQDKVVTVEVIRG